MTQKQYSHKNLVELHPELKEEGVTKILEENGYTITPDLLLSEEEYKKLFGKKTANRKPRKATAKEQAEANANQLTINDLIDQVQSELGIELDLMEAAQVLRSIGQDKQKYFSKEQAHLFVSQCQQQLEGVNLTDSVGDYATSRDEQFRQLLGNVASHLASRYPSQFDEALTQNAVKSFSEQNPSSQYAYLQTEEVILSRIEGKSAKGLKRATPSMNMLPKPSSTPFKESGTKTEPDSQ